MCSILEANTDTSTSKLPIEAKMDDDLSLFKEPAQATTIAPNLQNPVAGPQDAYQQSQESSPEMPQPGLTITYEPPTTSSTTTTTPQPGPATIENFPNYNISKQNFNVWEQYQPQYPEFNHQEQQAPVDPNKPEAQTSEDDFDKEVLPIDTLPGFVPQTSTTPAPPVTQPVESPKDSSLDSKNKEVTAASLLTKLVGKPPISQQDQSKDSAGATSPVVDALNSIDGPTVGQGVLNTSASANIQYSLTN